MFFYLSKILWFVINPFNFMLFLIFGGLLSHLLQKNLLSKLFYFIFFIFFIISSVVPTGRFMLHSLEKNFHNQHSLPNEVEGVLILSGSIDGILSKEYNTIHLNENAERLFESIALINMYPKAKIIFSGGPAYIFNKKIIQVDLAEEFFSKLGIDTHKINFESRSRNTYDNIFFSKIIANPKPKEKWLVVTSAFHMKRTLNIANKLKWNLIPYAVDFKQTKKFSWKPSINFLGNIRTFHFASHEWLGLVFYYLTGKSSKIF